MNVDEFIDTLRAPASRKQNVTPDYTAEELQRWQALLEERQSTLEEYENALAKRESLLNEIQKYLNVRTSVAEGEKPSSYRVRIDYDIKASIEATLSQNEYNTIFDASDKGYRALRDYIDHEYPWNDVEEAAIVNISAKPVEMYCTDTEELLFERNEGDK